MLSRHSCLTIVLNATASFLALSSLASICHGQNIERIVDGIEENLDAGNVKKANSGIDRLISVADGLLRSNRADLDAADALDYAGWFCQDLNRFKDAEQLHLRALKVYRAARSPDEIDSLLGLAATYFFGLSKYDEAEKYYREALKLQRKDIAEFPLDVADTLYDLGTVLSYLARYEEARAIFNEELKIRREHQDDDHPDIGWCLAGLAEIVASHDGDYQTAEKMYKDVLKIHEKHYDEDSVEMADSLDQFARLLYTQDRYAEAKPLIEKVLRIREEMLLPEDPAIAWAHLSLANIDTWQGRYVDAMPRYQVALAGMEKAMGANHPDLGDVLSNFAYCYQKQGRTQEAENLIRRNIEIQKNHFGKDSEEAAFALTDLADLYLEMGKYSEAETLYVRLMEQFIGAYGDTKVELAWYLDGYGVALHAQKRYAEAEQQFLKAIELIEAVLGENANLAITLQHLALMYEEQGRIPEAEESVDRAIEIRDRIGSGSDDRSDSYALRARLAWADDRRSEAVADLNRAIDLAEQQRVLVSGTERERAQSFTRFTDVFEQMVAWQVEVGNMTEALSAMERGRARSMLDELAVAGADLDAGGSAVEREQLRENEGEIRSQITAQVKRLERINENDSLSTQEKSRQSAEVTSLIGGLRGQLYELYREQRGNNAVYRNLISTGQGPPRISQVQRTLLGDNALLLSYLFGDYGGYLLAIDKEGVKLLPLMLDETTAEQLNVDAGPLNRERLGEILAREDNDGVLQQLKDPARAGQIGEQLLALRRGLLPEPYLGALINGGYSRMIVVPDGQLAALPFEALVIEAGDDPLYLLDLGPPIHYAPSVSVLFNLTKKRTGEDAAIGRQEGVVLSIGDPNYDSGKSKQEDSELTSQSRFVGLGGRLTPLPYSGTEARWVKQVFEKQGIKASVLTGADATEGNVAREVAGRSIVHFACHGLSDHSYGNFFGALALVPDAGDDGFLTLAEIYNLDLDQCDLTILSACETNIGPQQRGEGVWALSRGFLVAGSRRVVASNWLVDDQAASHLVSYFCSGLAQHNEDGSIGGYAESLRNAKRLIRKQEKWKSPYYWATFVVLGPE